LVENYRVDADESEFVVLDLRVDGDGVVQIRFDVEQTALERQVLEDAHLLDPLELSQEDAGHVDADGLEFGVALYQDVLVKEADSLVFLKQVEDGDGFHVDLVFVGQDRGGHRLGLVGGVLESAFGPNGAAREVVHRQLDALAARLPELHEYLQFHDHLLCRILLDYTVA